MNPNNNNTQNTNTNMGNATGNASPFVTPTPIGYTAPVQNTVAPQPMPAQGTPVTPQPMPAQGVQAPAQNVTPSAPAQTNNAIQTSQATNEDPNGKVQQLNIPPSNPVDEPQVINTKQSKGSNILLFIIIAALIYFAVNIDKMAEIYNNYMKTGSLTATNVNPDNTTAGFIKIDDSSSSMKVNNINFYNFRKNAEEKSISFNYEAFDVIEDVKSLNLYVEIYNADKELVYKELFDTNEKIEKDTSSNYSITLEEDIFNFASYALIVQRVGGDITSSSTLVCKFSDESYNYENRYHFISNSLASYDVSKTSLKDDDTSLETEYNSLNKTLNATFDNKTLEYTIDLNNTYEGYTPIYNKGLTVAIVKSRESLKEWICE